MPAGFVVGAAVVAPTVEGSLAVLAVAAALVRAGVGGAVGGGSAGRDVVVQAPATSMSTPVTVRRARRRPLIGGRPRGAAARTWGVSGGRGPGGPLRPR